MKEDRKICVSCHRPLPREESDAPVGPSRRRVLSLSIPIDEYDHFTELLEGLHEKYHQEWPELGPPGSKMWKYRALHFAVYAALTADLVPSEEGG